MPTLSDRISQAFVVWTERSNHHFLIWRTCLDYLIGGGTPSLSECLCCLIGWVMSSLSDRRSSAFTIWVEKSCLRKSDRRNASGHQLD